MRAEQTSVNSDSSRLSEIRQLRAMYIVNKTFVHQEEKTARSEVRQERWYHENSSPTAVPRMNTESLITANARFKR